MNAADTNVLVRLLAHDDPHQLEVDERFIAGGAWASHLVLVQSLWVMDAVLGRTASQIAAAL